VHENIILRTRSLSSKHYKKVETSVFNSRCHKQEQSTGGTCKFEKVLCLALYTEKQSIGVAFCEMKKYFACLLDHYLISEHYSKKMFFESIQIIMYLFLSLSMSFYSSFVLHFFSKGFYDENV